MRNKRQQPPAYSSIVGEGTEIVGKVHFVGALHIDGKVVGDIKEQSSDGCALTLGPSGVIEGNVDVAHVVLDGTIRGDVRAAYRAELKSGARIEGKVHYSRLQVPEGAEINGELVRIDEHQTSPLLNQSEGKEQTGDRKDPARKAVASDKTASNDLGSDLRSSAET
ncbi:bactofilin family protein [Candidatus Thiosymbion oneisti]|uniref:bactofilin family protein n=1 Tax=Candidatus Thiosymbion oneisti TaxID=589554 RepID=UPI00159F2224|nr:polymer-forming cytoskeletal protein [Candidatus Thiosymbion oneisti]